MHSLAQFDLSRVPSPCYVVDEAATERNLQVLARVQEESGAKVLLALKAFSMFAMAPLVMRYLKGTCASGLYEAKLGREYFGGEVHTYSAVMSWAACDRLANAADRLGKPDRSRFWRDRAGKIRATIEKQAWVENGEGGHFGASFESDYLDASLLQLVELRFIDPEDPRFRSTFVQIERELRRGEHMLRYAQEDDFGTPETAFNICTFWLIEALALVDRKDEARVLFETMLGHRTGSGLLSEDMDFETGELWGNFPQTYSLVGVINCAGLLSKSWNEIR